MCQKCTVVLSIEQLPFSSRLLWHKSTLTGHCKQNNKERRGKGTKLFSEPASVIQCVLLTDINCYIRAIKSTISFTWIRMFPITTRIQKHVSRILAIFFFFFFFQIISQWLCFPLRILHGCLESDCQLALCLKLTQIPRKHTHKNAVYICLWSLVWCNTSGGGVTAKIFFPHDFYRRIVLI